MLSTCLHVQDETDAQMLYYSRETATTHCKYKWLGLLGLRLRNHVKGTWMLLLNPIEAVRPKSLLTRQCQRTSNQVLSCFIHPAAQEKRPAPLAKEGSRPRPQTVKPEGLTDRSISERVLQSELDVALPLSALQQAQGGPEVVVRRVQNRGVEEVNEVTSKLDMLALRDGE